MARIASCRRRWRPIEGVSPQVPNASRCLEKPRKSTFTGSLSHLNPAPDEARIEPPRAVWLAKFWPANLTATSPWASAIGGLQAVKCARDGEGSKERRYHRPPDPCGASKSRQARARDALLAERRPGLVHGCPENALRHEIGLCGKSFMIDIPLEALRLTVIGCGARRPLRQVRGQLEILLLEQRARSARQRGRSTGECGDLFGLGLECRRQQVGGVAVPPATPQPQEIAHDELWMVIDLVQIGELGKDLIGAHAMND